MRLWYWYRSVVQGYVKQVWSVWRVVIVAGLIVSTHTLSQWYHAIIAGHMVTWTLDFKPRVYIQEKNFALDFITFVFIYPSLSMCTFLLKCKSYIEIYANLLRNPLYKPLLGTGIIIWNPLNRKHLQNISNCITTYSLNWSHKTGYWMRV